MNPVVYISAELKARDLDSRLLVATEAIKRGLIVVFGQQWVISRNFLSMPAGAVLFKTVNEIQAEQMFDASQAGHIVAASDEEVLACACEVCFESGMGPTAARVLDVFFAQGQQHAATVARQYPSIENRLEITGNPRIDLLRSRGRSLYEGHANQIRAQLGKYILFNTNFGWINSIWNAREDTKQIAIRTGHLDLDDPESVAAYEAELDWERANMAELEGVIEWMTDGLPDVKAVIRPHPAEDSGYWKTKYGERKNVVIVEGTPHIPWTLGAEALVHTTCSTGMEAALMDKPALSITPIPNAALHSYLLTNSVNPTVSNWREAAEALSTFFRGGSGPLSERSSYHSTLAEFFPVTGNSNAAALIADKLLTLIQKRGGQVDTNYSWGLRPGQNWIPLNRRDEWKEKFSLEIEELSSRLQAMGDLVQVNKSINVQKLDDSLFLMFGT